MSLTLVFTSLLLFAFTIKQRDHEDTHRLALFPLDADDPQKSVAEDSAATNQPRKIT